MSSLNGNIGRTTKILLLIFSIIAILWSSFRTYAYVQFISDLNKIKLHELDQNLNKWGDRVVKNEKAIIKCELKDEQIKELFIELKSELKEINTKIDNLRR